MSSLQTLVASAPGISARPDSSMYNFKRRIASPRDALVLVGNLTFARLCFTLSLEPVLNNDLPCYDLDYDHFLTHFPLLCKFSDWNHPA